MCVPAPANERNSFTVLCGTWNVNAQAHAERLDGWLCQDDQNNELKKLPDIYAITCVELIHMEGKHSVGLCQGTALWYRRYVWESRLLGELNTKAKTYTKDPCQYVLLESKQLSGVLLMIFIKKSMYPYVSFIRSFKKLVGVKDVDGNKAGVAISFKLFDTRLVFVGAQLAPHKGKLRCNERHNQFEEIYKSCQFPDDNPDVVTYMHIKDHDYQFWMGDLNYRLTDQFDTFDKAHKIITEKDFQTLLHGEELHVDIIEMKAGRMFEGWEEGHIDFAPTFKYEVRPGMHPLKYDSSEVPAWCDRILWRTIEPDTPITQHYYKRSDMTMSDHVPVASLFGLQYLRTNACPPKEEVRSFFGSSSWEVVEVFQFSVMMMCLGNLSDVFQNAWCYYFSFSLGGLHFWEREAESITGYSFNPYSQCVLLASQSRFGCQFKTHPQNIFLVVVANWLTIVVGSGLLSLVVYMLQFAAGPFVASIRSYPAKIRPLLMYGAFLGFTMDRSAYAIISVCIFQIKVMVFYGETGWGLLPFAVAVMAIFFLYLWAMIYLSRTEARFHEVQSHSIMRSIFGVVLLNYKKEYQYWPLVHFFYGASMASVVALGDYGPTALGTTADYSTIAILQNCALLLIQSVYFVWMCRVSPYRETQHQRYVSILHFCRIPLIIMSLIYAVLYTEPFSSDPLRFSFVYLIFHGSQLGFSMAWPFWLSTQSCAKQARKQGKVLYTEKQSVSKALDLNAIRQKVGTQEADLMQAAWEGHENTLLSLLNLHPNLFAKDHDGWSYVMCASWRGNQECLRYLIDANCHLNTYSTDGMSALMLAAEQGHIDCLQLLLQAQCNVNSSNTDGDTALILATYFGHPKCVEQLLQAELDVDLRDAGNKSAACYAFEQYEKYPQMFQGVLQHDPNLSGVPVAGLKVAVQRGYAPNVCAAVMVFLFGVFLVPLSLLAMLWLSMITVFFGYTKYYSWKQCRSQCVILAVTIIFIVWLPILALMTGILVLPTGTQASAYISIGFILLGLSLFTIIFQCRAASDPRLGEVDPVGTKLRMRSVKCCKTTFITHFGVMSTFIALGSCLLDFYQVLGLAIRPELFHQDSHTDVFVQFSLINIQLVVTDRFMLETMNWMTVGMTLVWLSFNSLLLGSLEYPELFVSKLLIYIPKLEQIVNVLSNAAYLTIMGNLLSIIDCTYHESAEHGHYAAMDMYDDEGLHFICFEGVHQLQSILALLFLVMYQLSVSTTGILFMESSDLDEEVRWKESFISADRLGKLLMLIMNIFFTDYDLVQRTVMALQCLFFGVMAWVIMESLRLDPSNTEQRKPVCSIRFLGYVKAMCYIMCSYTCFVSLITSCLTEDPEQIWWPFIIMILGWIGVITIFYRFWRYGENYQANSLRYTQEEQEAWVKTHEGQKWFKMFLERANFRMRDRVTISGHKTPSFNDQCGMIVGMPSTIPLRYKVQLDNDHMIEVFLANLTMHNNSSANMNSYQTSSMCSVNDQHHSDTKLAHKYETVQLEETHDDRYKNSSSVNSVHGKEAEAGLLEDDEEHTFSI